MGSIQEICKEIVVAAEAGCDADDMRRIILGGPVLEDIFEHSLAVEHVLGFAQLRLGSYRGRLVRIHLWNTLGSGRYHSDGDVHSHMWPLRSYVLGGRVENEVFDVTRCPDGPGEIYEVQYSQGGSHRVRLETRVTLGTRKTERLERGMRYDVGAEDFHSSKVGQESVTLIVTGARTGRSPIVVRQAGSVQAVQDYPLLVVPRSGLRWRFEKMRQVIG
jgi:hypothetical protein